MPDLRKRGKAEYNGDCVFRFRALMRSRGPYQLGKEELHGGQAFRPDIPDPSGRKA